MNKKASVPKISIITPAYNNETFLRDLANALFQQSFADYEWIIINDASTDNTNIVLDKLALCDNRIRVFSNLRNRGAGYSRNIGIQNARAEWLTFIDSDDTVSETYLRDFWQIASSGLIHDIICQRADAPSRKRESPRTIVQPDITRLFFASMVCTKQSDSFPFFTASACSRLYRTSFLIENHVRFPDEKMIGEDFIFSLRCINHAKSVFLDFSHFGYHYRQNQKSTMHSLSLERDNLAGFYSLLISTILENTQETFSPVDISFFICSQALAHFSLLLGQQKKSTSRDKARRFIETALPPYVTRYFSSQIRFTPFLAPHQLLLSALETGRINYAEEALVRHVFGEPIWVRLMRKVFKWLGNA